jgi:hypothetical protein
MTRRLHQSPARGVPGRAIERDHQRPVNPASSSFVEGGLAVVEAGLAKLADQISDECLVAVLKVIQQSGLLWSAGSTDRLRQIILEVVAERLGNSLVERVAAIVVEPKVVANPKLPDRRAAILRLLVEIDHD